MDQPVELASRRIAFVMSGGVALSAWEGGAYAAMAEAGMLPDRVVGVSAGAITAAIIAGNPPERRVGVLRGFWESLAADPAPLARPFLGPPPAEGAWRKAHNASSAMQNLLFGRAGLFRPKLAGGAETAAGPGLHDLAPLGRRLPELVDFDLLNSPAAPRTAIVATDVETGERVEFDTARGMRIGPEHIIASCALLPLFAPVEVEGRLLGDGGLSANLPLDLALEGPGEVTCLAVDLFGRRGSRPPKLSEAAARAGDIIFANQTRALADALRREHRLRSLLARATLGTPVDEEVAGALAEGPRTVALALLGYRAAPAEAGVIKPFDFSPVTLEERWASGQATMAAALRRLREAPVAPGEFRLEEVEG
jgi:NTE family protein